MKRIATLLLTAGLVFAGVTGASAIDFKAKGQFIMSFDLGKTNTNGAYGFDGKDSFEATQRIRLGVEAIASESLSGTVFFEMGNTTWGKSSEGGALGTDGKIVEVKHAYIDWIVPSTELKVRMGLQALGLPSYTTGTSQIFVHDVAAVVLNNKFNDNVSVTAFWARPFNDNYDDDNQAWGDNSNSLDNVDSFGLVVPMTFNNVKVTPWVMYTMVGQNYARDLDNLKHTSASDYEMANGQMGTVGYGLLPVGTVANNMLAGNPGDLFAYGNVWHAGLTGEASFGGPFSLAWDFNYGNSDFGDDNLSREGFLVSLLAEYKMDWGTPGLYAWYTSGDDDSTRNGSERMPIISTTGGTNEFSSFAFSGAKYIERECVVAESLVGTWGIGARITDMSFVEDLKHTFRVNYFQGTNHEDMAAEVSGGFNHIYLTTEDWALEFGLTNTYKIYDNLTLSVEAAYIYFDMNADAWSQGDYDTWNINTSFVYSF